MATRPESGVTRPASSPGGGDFPAPLRPTTPTRSPADTPSETPSSSVRCAYALAAFSRLIRFTADQSPDHGDDGRAGHRPRGAPVAPGTGPVARATVRHTPAPDRDAARSSARSALAARNTQVGP